MGSVSSVEAAYVTTAVVHDVVFLIGIILAFFVGFFRPRKYTDYTLAMLRRLRYIILVISLSALVYSVGFWFLFKNTGTYTRPDGETTEWASWVARGILFTGVAWAIAEALYMKIAAGLLFTATIFFDQLVLVLANFVTTNAQFAIVTAFYIFLLISALVLVYAWQHVTKSLIWLHLIVPGFLFLWIALDGLWAFLSNNMWDAMGFGNQAENWLFTAIDIAFTLTAIIGLTIMYSTSVPSPDTAVYPEYKESKHKAAKKIDVESELTQGSTVMYRV